MKRKLLSILLAAALFSALLPTAAFAADPYMWPVPASKTITQKYKSGSHLGIDIGGSKGIDVVATKAGTVFYVYTGCVNNNAASSSGKSCTSAGCSPNCGTYTSGSKKVCNWGYGNGVIVKHSDGSGYSMYAHMQTVSVSKGQTVKQGAKLGTLGSSGNSTGAHLHFELTASVQQSGTYFKPTASINSNTDAISYVSTASSSGTTVTTPSVSFALPTDSTYTAKQKITDTNAVVVNKITKASGTSVTKMGVYLYDASGTQLKKYTENVSNVAASTTTYHSWYDINSEVGVTLTPGTKYQYKFFGVFNGVEVSGSTYSFTTTGTAPVKTYTAFFHLTDSSAMTRTVTPGKAYGTLPTAPEREGYTFDGWYTAETGGTKITATTVFNGSASIDLYPHYTKNAVVEPEPEPEPEPEVQSYTVSFCDPITTEIVGTYTVTNGQKYPTPSDPTRYGYTFDGWYTSRSGGTRITGSTTVNLTANQTLYAQWTKNAAQEEEPAAGPSEIVISLIINNPNITINAVSQPIDSSGTTPVIRSSRTLLPVRAVIEAMGGTVGWNGDTRTTTMTVDGKT
ncbi:MAG: InlB B-repeat-containing protein, partial [Butyricicoccus sp.]